MPNLLEYAKEYGETSLEARPFDALDALVLTQLVYLPLEGLLARDGACSIAEAWDFIERTVEYDAQDPFQKKRWKLFRACAGLSRYAGWEVTDYVSIIDEGREMQFCACTYRLPDGLSVIAYRGTDLTVVGWKEDFNMSYMTVPSQHEAAEYAFGIARRTGDALILCGHSKGGNLAVYAAAATDASTRERIRRVYTFDGPGVDEETLNSYGYALVHERIESYLPQSSVVGMLLNYHPVYTVVDSYTIGILQHDVMTWKIRDGAFVTVANVDITSKITDEALHAWLAGMEPEERRMLVETLYQVVDAAEAELVTDLATDWLESTGRMLAAVRSLDAGAKRQVARMLHSLFSTGASEALKQIVASLLQLKRGEAEV